jgi:DNA-binding transcriptional LysR family regulator
MEMHQVRYFLVVARTLNFTKAADECHVAQPSLSRAIKKLEEELGGDLFCRERGLTHLTELGRLMLPLLTQCYDSARAAKSLAQSFKSGTTAPLRLALSHTIDMQLLVAPLTELVKAFPGLELKFLRGTCMDVGEHLKRGEAELGLACPLREPWDRLESWVLFTEPFVLAVNEQHPFANRSSVGIDELARVRLLPRVYCEQATALDQFLESHGIAHVFSDTIASDQDLLTLMQANVGVSVVPASTRAADRLRLIEVEGLDLVRPVVLYAVAGRQRSAAASGLLKLLRAHNWTATFATGRGAPGHKAANAEPGARARA